MGKNPAKFLQIQLPISALRHPEKYKGRNRLLELKSSWEISFVKYLDANENALGWTYEETPIVYPSPLDNTGRPHRYWVDFSLEYYSIDKKVKDSLIEIKPWYEIQYALSGKVEFKTKVSQKEKQNVLETAMINAAKWKAAQEFCRRNNMKFVLLSERDMILSGSSKFKPD